MIDHFNGMPGATEYLSDMQGKLAISVITRAEVLTGFEGRAIADLAATLQRRNRWKIPDALQARFVIVPYTL